MTAGGPVCIPAGFGIILEPERRAETRVMDDFNPSAVTLDEWRKMAEAGLDGRGLDSLERRTEDGLTIKALYSAADLPDVLPELGRPGWTVAQEIEPASDAAGLNRVLLDEFTEGAGRVELPASIDPGLLADALEGVELEAVRIGFAPGSDWAAAAKALLHTGAGARACLGADPVLGLLHGRGDDSDGLAGLLDGDDGAATVFAMAGDEYHLLGLAPAEELAVVLGATAHILRRLDEGGIGPAAALGRMEWRFAGEADLYGGIAKTRALGLLLKQFAAAAGGGPNGIEERLHGVTSARHLSRLDPETNILRNGTALLAMALGGAGTITVRPHDWLTGASPEALRLARNAHHLMAAEGRLDSVADPASGSYFIEAMTGELARHAWGLFQQIEKAGGAAEAAGLIREWAGKAAEARQAAVNEGRDDLLGVTIHPAREAGGGQGPVLDGAFGPRGGAARPAAPWEGLRAEAGGSRRCLLLDREDKGRDDKGAAEACGRWFHAAGLEAVPVRSAGDKEAVEAVSSARPDVLVLGGIDDPAPYAEAAGKSCRVLAASDFKGDLLELMRGIVGGAK